MDPIHSFGGAVKAVLPFLIYLGIGYFAVAVHITDRAFMNRLNKFAFTLLFPFMTFNSVCSASRDGLPSAKLLIFAAVGILALEGLLLLIVPRIIKENPRRGVVIQGIVRSNFVLYGVPMTISLFPDGASVAGILLLEVVSIFNITSVIILEIFNTENGGRVHFRALPGKLLKNPFLQGCLLGLLFFVCGWELPEALAKPVAALGNSATPVAMITLGGTLTFSALRKNRRIITGVVSVRLVLLPIVTLLLAYAVGLRGVELFLTLMIAGTPTATASYPMAANMGGDGELAGQLVFVSTVASLVTIFWFIFGMSQLGLL